MKTQKINVELTGIRPVLFDRYGGTNQTVLKIEEKMYLDSEDRVMLPMQNLYSMMSAENTKSVCKLFMGKQGRMIAHAIACFTRIDAFDIPFLSEGKPVKFTGFDEKIKVHHAVARLNKGIPNPKERPMLMTPWTLAFTMELVENKMLTLSILRNVLEFGGQLGIGTYRPFYGQFELTKFDIV